MELAAKFHAPSKNPFLTGLLSLLVPGAGQIYQKKFSRGSAIFATTLVLLYLIDWGLDNFKIGLATIGSQKTSFLYLGLAIFWMWNAYDAFRIARGLSTYNSLGLLLPAVIIYIIAWQVTDVNLDRLVTRFNDAKIVFNALAHPDLFERDKVTQVGRATFWVPCSNPPQPSGAYPLSVDKSCGTIGDTITVRGENFPPGTVGLFYWVLLESTSEVQAREEGKAVEAVVGDHRDER